jgi:hypothetical protein
MGATLKNKVPGPSSTLGLASSLLTGSQVWTVLHSYRLASLPRLGTQLQPLLVPWQFQGP